MALIKGSWNRTKLVCGQHPDLKDAPAMTLTVTGASMTPVYACTHRGEDEKSPCSNCLSLYEYEKMLDQIAKEVITAEENDESFNLTNYRWKRKSFQFDVVKFSDDEVIVMVQDKLATK